MDAAERRERATELMTNDALADSLTEMARARSLSAWHRQILLASAQRLHLYAAWAADRAARSRAPTME